MADATRELFSALLDKQKLSYGAGHLFGGPALDALIPDVLDLTDLDWLPALGSASDIGRTQGITITLAKTKVDLTSADDGERAADRGASSITWRVSGSLADGGIVKLSQLIQGIELEYWESSGSIKRIIFPDRLYELDSERFQPFLFRAYRRGILSTNPLDNLLFFKATDGSEESEISFTPTDQRVYPFDLMVYKDTSRLFTDPDTGEEIPLHGTSFAYPDDGSASSSSSSS